MSVHVERLRAIASALESEFRAGGAIASELRSAAAEIERLSAENEALRATLKFGVETVRLAGAIRRE